MRCKYLLVLCILVVSYGEAFSATSTLLHSFNATPDGAVPSGALVADAAGNLYGSSGGGAYGYGTVYELTPAAQGGWTHIVLYNFKGGADGSLPLGNLVFDKSGDLYGLTQEGGIHGCYYNAQDVGCGTLFKLTFAGGGWTESILYRFSPSEGGLQLSGSLVLDAAGNFYSTTNESTGLLGSIFQLSAASGQWADTIVHTFTGGSDGSYLNAPLLVDQAGNIYGTTLEGGPANHGLVFEFMPAGGNQWTETILYSFSGGSDGGAPRTGLTTDRSGNLYGGTAAGGTGCGGSGCGVIFKLTPGSNGQYSESVLYDFRNMSVAPNGLTLNAQGNIYGSTFAGGTCYQCGTVFELSSSGGVWKESRLWKFKGGTDGEFPSLIIVNAAGQVFGTSFAAGDAGNGTVFELAPGSGQDFIETTIYDFPYGTDGANPVTPLIADGAGNLYGTAGGGGSSDHGVVFQLVPQPDGSWKENI
ncbi:MAG: hypothetical protein H0X25_16340, partial [Acidobacteriales bacterium]|nr:hypothetical protein [Terriglobales bacterium]